MDSAARPRNTDQRECRLGSCRLSWDPGATVQYPNVLGQVSEPPFPNLQNPDCCVSQMLLSGLHNIHSNSYSIPHAVGVERARHVRSLSRPWGTDEEEGVAPWARRFELEFVVQSSTGQGCVLLPLDHVRHQWQRQRGREQEVTGVCGVGRSEVRPRRVLIVQEASGWEGPRQQSPGARVLGRQGLVRFHSPGASLLWR